MLFSELIDALGKYVNVNIEIEDGAVALEVDEMPVVIMDAPDNDSLVISGRIGMPPPEGLERLYAAVLEANHNFLGTFGATLSRNPDDGCFELCQMLSCAAMDGEKFVKVVENFINTLSTWKNIVTNYRDNGASLEEHNVNDQKPLDVSGGFTGLLRV